MKDLKSRVVRGSVAKVCSQLANLVLRLGSIMVLARLLDPKDFGLVAMVTAITGVFSLFKDAGLSMATIQRLTITHEEMSTMFWLNMLVGVVLASLLVAIAPFIAQFYHEPRLFWVVVALSFDFIFTGAAAQHSALLQRQMRFGAVATIDMLTLLVGIVVVISLAAEGWGYWALVGQAVVSPAVNAVCTWVFARWVPGMPSRKVGIKSMVRFGGMVSLNGLVIYIAYNLEKVLLGRFWGAESLGVYGRAYQLINIPTENLNSSIFGVAFSALSRIQDDPGRQNRYFLKGYSLLLTLTLPITLACAVFADDMVFVILGQKWKDAAPIFRLLAPTIFIFALINPFGWFLLSSGRAERSLKIALVIAPLVIAAYIVGLPYGPKGVALAYSSAMALWVIPHIIWCIHGTGISVRNILQTVSRPFISGIMAAAVAYGVQSYFGHFVSFLLEAGLAIGIGIKFDPSLTPFLRLVLGVGVMFVCYLLILLYVMGQKAVYADLLRGLRNRPTVNEEKLA